MNEDRFVLLDTKAFDAALEKKEGLIKSYNEINQEYDRIVEKLMKNWKGRGASAFEKDAATVKTNIVGIFDILKVLCDTLTDCKAIFAECDVALGEYNRNPDAEGSENEKNASRPAPLGAGRLLFPGCDTGL